MRDSWKGLVFSSLALHVAGTQIPALPPGFVLWNGQPVPVNNFASNNSNVGFVGSVPTIKPISLHEIIPSVDASGNSRCCPIGTINDGHGCVFPESSVCPKGTRLEGNICVSIHPPRCPGRLIFNGQVCITREGPKCPVNTFPDGLSCVSIYSPECPSSGFKLDSHGHCIGPEPKCDIGYNRTPDNRCVSINPPECQGGTRFYQGKCVGGPPKCKGKATFQNGQCVGEPPACPEGYNPDPSGKCIHDDLPVCPSGSEPKGNVCITKSPPKCVLGELDNNVCKAEPECPHGFELENLTCVLKSDPECPKDTYPSESRQTPPKAACCPKGYHFNGNGCFIFTDDPIFCPERTHWDDMYCVSDDPTEDEPPVPLCPPNTELKNNQCEKKTLPKCSDGSEPINGECIMPTPRCPEGSNFDGERCVVGPALCPEGSYPYENKCISKDPPVCPPNFHRDGDSCISTEPAVCPPNFHRVGDQCLHIKLPVCDGNNMVHEAGCASPKDPVCNSESHLVNGKCVLITGPVCGPEFDLIDKKCIPKTGGVPQCPPLFTFDGKDCISPDEDPLCPPDHHFDGQKCVSRADPKCADNLRWDGTKCVSNDDPECPPDQRLAPEGCVTKDDPRCPQGTEYARETNSCVSTTIICPTGTELRGDECVSKIPPRCPRDTVMEDGKCVHRKKPTCGADQEPVNGLCISRKPPTCGQGMTFDQDTKRCVIGMQTQCFSMEVCPTVGVASLPAPSNAAPEIEAQIVVEETQETIVEVETHERVYEEVEEEEEDDDDLEE